MNDRELLELAAKAAGIELTPMEIKNVKFVGDDRFIGFMADTEKCPRGWFNPLTDDGDALRLAVKLGLHIEPWFDDEDVREVIVYGIGSHKEPDADDRMAATRRAIVRAAAEVGRAMP